ncbi:putative non-inhibitory serpin-Z5 [Raphanus sativus]|nr:putative non-inhibitory serpin-Z5 [Raphanus sativus]
MDPKEKRQKLSTPAELKSPSLSLSRKDVAAITSPSLNSKVDVGEAMKKQNDVAMFLTEKVISALARNSNFVFSPASVNAVLTMVAVTSGEESLRSLIFSILRTSSVDELNAVFHEVANTVLVDGSENGGPKILRLMECEWSSPYPLVPPRKISFRISSKPLLLKLILDSRFVF